MISSLSLYARTIISADESDNSEYLICSLKPVYSAKKQKVLYTIFKDKEKIYYSSSQLTAVEKMLELSAIHFCKIKSEECLLVEPIEDGSYSIVMQNSMYFRAGKTKSEAVATLTKLQKYNVCIMNGIQFAEFDFN